MRNPLRLLITCLFAIAVPASLEAVVISEIFYNPPAGDEALEFIEVAADSTTPEDISGYRFSDGVLFEFPPGTILGKGERIVVCADVDALRERYDIDNAVGNWGGRLDSGGERVTLTNQVGIVVQSLRYRDEGKWPVEADGTGHTLILRNLRLDSKEPESWTFSPELGGSPGTRNLPDDGGPVFEDRTLIAAGETWRYLPGTEAFSTPSDAWREVVFDDDDWLSGATGIGYGDGDDATVLDDMRNGYTTVACRKRFDLSADDLAAPGEVLLGMQFDDGFCAYLNGAFVAGSNCDETLDWNDTSLASHEASGEELFVLSRDALRVGENVLAILGVNFAVTSSDFSLAPRMIVRREITSETEGPSAVVFNELYRGAAPGDGWVEIYNTSGGDADLSGVEVFTDPDVGPVWPLPPGSVVAPSGFLVVDEATSGLDFSAPDMRLFLRGADGRVLTATSFDRQPVDDPPGGGPAAGTWSEARFPDGGELDWLTETPTRGLPNRVDAVTELVINEIFYHPPEDRGGEFLELFNRGDDALDVSGFRFDKGIDYAFPPDTVIAAGGFLVVAGDPDLIREHHDIDAFGPWAGQLADAGENLRLVDRAGNPVDEVRYHDGGRWSRWADGRGSSLELIDPLQDNAVASAWEASDERDKAPWERLAYDVTGYVPSGQSELHLFLVERGECLIDDVSISRDGGANHIGNPGFETNTTPWRIEGTHIHSRRTTRDSHSGSACLEVRASGKGDTGVNRIETDTSPRLTRGAYEVALWARWQRGSSLIIAHGEFTAGAFPGRPGPAVNLSGNTLGGRLRMTVPLNLGTPGAENGARTRLREETGSDNLGPVISGVVHSPPSPAPGTPIRFHATATDSDGVVSVRVFHRENDADGAFASVELRDDGESRDGRAGDGHFSAQIAGVANRARVVFYVEATDALGAVRRFPVDAPERTLVLQAQGTLNHSIDTYRVVMDAQRSQELTSRRLHSNDLLDGAFVFDNDSVSYNVGVRYRGSPWGRPGRNSYRVRFQKDDRFHRGRVAINMSSRGASPVEGTAYFIIGRNGSVLHPAPTADYLWYRGYLNGSSLGIQGMIQPVDGDYIDKWYGDGAEGPVLKANGRLQFDDNGSRTAWDGASYIHMGEVTENYRAYYFHSVEQTRDDWTQLWELTRVMDRRVTGNTAHDAQIGSILDRDAWFRVISVRVLIGGWDAFSIGNGHNGYLAFDARDGRWEILPFDMDNSFGNANFPLYPTADADVARMMSRPESRRIYLRILTELLEGYWSRAKADPWLDAMQRDVGHGVSSIKSFLTNRGNIVAGQIRSFQSAPFRIRTNGGDDVTTDETTIELEGEAPVQVATLFVRRDDGDLVEIEPRWASPTVWRAEFDLPQAENDFAFLGFNGAGELVGSTNIHITSTFHSGLPRVTAWFPAEGPLAGGFEVSFFGARLDTVDSVFFGGVESPSVTIDSAESLRAVAPPAPVPLPPEGVVDVEFRLLDGGSVVVERAIEYQIPGGAFVRGDANGDGSINVSDPVQTLRHLFAGVSIVCADAGDFDDDGALRISDAVGTLEFLYRAGDPPAAPFPLPGADSTDDALSCREEE